jgi:hypothetical protein
MKPRYAYSLQKHSYKRFVIFAIILNIVGISVAAAVRMTQPVENVVTVVKPDQRKPGVVYSVIPKFRESSNGEAKLQQLLNPAQGAVVILTEGELNQVLRIVFTDPDKKPTSAGYDVGIPYVGLDVAGQNIFVNLDVRLPLVSRNDLLQYHSLLHLGGTEKDPVFSWKEGYIGKSPLLFTNVLFMKYFLGTYDTEHWNSVQKSLATLKSARLSDNGLVLVW